MMMKAEPPSKTPCILNIFTLRYEGKHPKNASVK
jgi:hypothetical protein